MSDATLERERRFLDDKEVYRQILDAIADAVLVKGAESRILWANKAFREYYGMTNEELRDLIDASFNNVDYTAQYVRDDQHVYTTGEVLDIPEEPATRHDGLVQIFHTVKSPIRDDAGRVVMTVGVARNITDSKRAQEDLARYREQLEGLVAARTDELSRLSNDLSTILSSLAEGIVAVDAEGRVRLMNTAAKNLLGCTSDDALGKNVQELIEFSPERGEAQSGFSLERVRTSVHALAGRLRSNAGEQRMVSIQAAPLKGTDEAAGTVLVLRDITIEREVADQRLRNQKLESLGLLAGGIAHDFNNILTAILGSISLARIESARGQSADEVLRNAEHACLHAQGLTNQLLTFARGGKPIKKAIDVVQPVREAAELALRGSPCRLVLTHAPEVAPIDGDEGQLVQAISNLVMNAKQAMPAGGQVTIDIGNVTVNGSEQPPLSPGDYVRIVVRDRGTGIAPEHIQRIFDPYFTTKTTGSGLGLASVHSIVSQHGGHVTVSSTLGEGSVFSLYLPITSATPSIMGAAPSPRATGTHQRILVLDDDEGVRRVMARVLSLWGHDAVIVAQSAQAFDAFDQAKREEQSFDTVFVDLTMPGDLPGAEVIKRFLERDPNTRIIVMSGYSNDPIMANYREYGVSARLQKPFTAKDVRDMID